MDELESYSLAEDEDKWITINGSHVKIDENGDVVAGAEGKINSNKNEKKSAGEKLSANEKSAISSYSGDNFLKINSDLRKGKDEDPDVARIDSAIGKGGLEGGTLYRGMSREDAKKLFPGGDIKKGMVVSDPAFLSTSKEKKIAGMFSIGGVMLQIETNKGDKGLDVTGLSSNKHEDETLLPRNAKMEVIGVHPPKSPGQPVTIKVRYISEEKRPAMDGITESLAFDRASVRTIDANGRLQISRTNISKANVNAYYGREIPRSEELGLEPNKLYRLWRHPDELRKAAKTFNNIPVLSKHIPDFPTDPPNEFRVGVTHSNAEFDGTYLTVGMSIWDNSAIAGIESGEQRELSASYKYVADMTPGVTPDGEPYDGVMRDIFGNHEALVPDGRAGPDVLVADSLPPELNHMRKHKVAAIRATLKPLLAQDADLEAEVRKALLALDEAEKEDKKENKPADDEDDDEKDKKKTADDEDDDEDKDKKKTAEDEDDEEDDKVCKTAMDSAIRLAADSATKKAAENFRKIREAELVVRPLIGDVVAMDSAEDVYRTALEQSGVDIAGVHPSAYPAMVKMAISQKENSRPVIAQDSASVSEFEKAFPTAGKLKRG
ncbi:Putative NAD(+)--arginine ADP-ribosyltransferase Vis precursor [Klebsiella quasivariicola]|uniref:NAD(+)--protein-arginine ADP-ribosyltransferase n=4 Tax=Klebsiella/Raoultella group TaxID=2890311 RepID=A0A8B4TQN0_9ENTR|nr:Putative NAD(+)--arginine ADP-ribosyltransferase Vis precursor [Klebsiella quasivariicola]